MVSVLAFKLIDQLEGLGIVEVDRALVVITGWAPEDDELTWGHDGVDLNAAGQERLGRLESELGGKRSWGNDHCDGVEVGCSSVLNDSDQLPLSTDAAGIKEGIPAYTTVLVLVLLVVGRNLVVWWHRVFEILFIEYHRENVRFVNGEPGKRKSLVNARG